MVVPFHACDVALHTPPTYRQLRLEGGQGHVTSISHVAVCHGAPHGLHTEAALLMSNLVHDRVRQHSFMLTLVFLIPHSQAMWNASVLPLPERLTHGKQCEDPGR
jgi:hypothetical protein